MVTCHGNLAGIKSVLIISGAFECAIVAVGRFLVNPLLNVSIKMNNNYKHSYIAKHA